MKRILITGANSYIGTSFEKYMEQYGSDYQIDTLDMRGDEWRGKDFSPYDSIIHLAAIVHVKEKDDSLYYKVNRDLAVETAERAKNEGVEQFIYFSSMSVYGINSGRIDSNTKENPLSPYAKSKLEAENILNSLKSEKFKVAIVRPPMVYGDGAKGNYEKLIKLAKINPFFPSKRNERSMISAENLNRFLRLVIDQEKSGVLFPQDSEYVSTANLYKKIRENSNRGTIFISLFNPVITYFSRKISFIEKMFGNLTYSYDMDGSPYLENYTDKKVISH